MATAIPKNHATFELEDILRITGGALIRGAASREHQVLRTSASTSVSTDSRAVDPGACFIALRGETHDGHTHLEAAAKAGALIAIVDHDVPLTPLTLVRVKDTLVALGDLAREHARRWRRLGQDRKIVAITGSAGKTTTRVAVAALLEETSRSREVVASSRGNLNNRIGLPMVLLGLEAHHEVAVVEMGMNQRGEIAELCRIAEPEIGVVTLIAAAHTEGVGSIEAVAEEKGALFHALPESGVAIGNADDRRVMVEFLRSPARRRYRYGCVPDADRWISARSPVGMTSSRVRIGDIELTTPLLGEAGALACAAAIAVVECAFGRTVDGPTCTRAFARAEVGAGAGRLVPRVLPGDIAVIDDTYNANPASSCASIQAAAEIARATDRRLILVLGEMRELGALSAQGHDEVGRAAAASGASEVFAVGGGDASRIAARAVEGGVLAAHARRVEDIAVLVRRAAQPGDLILVKGSRSIGTERIVAALTPVTSATSAASAASAPSVMSDDALEAVANRGSAA